ncbi:hypothetical protein K4F52_010054 [Lecanicillium sp. MT-2017a]|nr:hypothetical protein K4F52_010054 [Lecanicillium sp. MT-2017a]
MPLDHISISVPSDKHSQVVDFYKKLLKPMSYEVRMNFGQVVGMGSTEAGPTSIDFWIAATEGTATTAHLAFSAKDRSTVDEFHSGALAAGAKCNGPPGLRPNYHPNYYGAFVIDPIGNNIEAVCHSG